MIRFHLKVLLFRLIWLVSLPGLILILPQAIYVKRKTLRLPEASGRRAGVIEREEDLTILQTPNTPSETSMKLLHIGESTVAGVGVQDIQNGFTSQIAQQLSSKTHSNVHWHIHGVNGIRLQELIDQLPTFDESFDVVVVTMGVNDTTKLTPIRQWYQSLNTLTLQLSNVTNGPIFFTQVPPMMQFPALPSPLKWWLGLRSMLLDFEIQRLCKVHGQAVHLGAKLKVAKEMMAEDGYHPSALGYENWAMEILPTMEQHLQP